MKKTLINLMIILSVLAVNCLALVTPAAASTVIPETTQPSTSFGPSRIEMSVYYGGPANTIPDGDTTPTSTKGTDFGSLTAGEQSTPRTFTIYNSSEDMGSTLHLTGTPTIQITGDNATDFIVTEQPASTTVAWIASTTFKLAFKPGAAGVTRAEIVISNDSFSTQPFNFIIQGTGLPSNTEIDSVEDWTNLMNQSAGWEWDKDYILTADINFGGAALTPVGNDVTPFTGSVNGTGHKISNATISGTGSTGVFGCTGPAAHFSNLGIENFSIASTGDGTGILAGYADDDTTITNCYATGNISSNNGQAGGLVGYGSRTVITGSYAAVSITADGSYIGGLAGLISSGSIADSYATGDVNSGIDNAGGLVGYAMDVVITGCHATGEVTGQNDNTGGLVGYITISSIADSYATGDVVNYNIFAGGLVGFTERTDITGCYATGNIETITDGGGFGGQQSSGTITNCYARGAVNALTYAGSFLGYGGEPGQTVTNCFGTGHVAGITGGGAVIWGFGYIEGDVNNSYWDTETTGHLSNTPGPTGLTTDNMTYEYAAAAYVGWDFTDTWVADSAGYNGGYPYLAWQTFNFPEMNVTGNGITIADGETTPFTTTGTNFGVIMITGTVTHTFTIQNTGTAILTVTSINGSAEFTISGIALPATVPPAGSTNFTVTFSPTDRGIRNASISISNNDADENPYDFTVFGIVYRLITSTADWINVTTNASLWTNHFILTADLDFGGATIQPIGTSAISFAGSVNGTGHRISNVTINANVNQSGLFGNLGTGSSVSQLKIDNIYVLGISKNIVGSLAGKCNGIVSNVQANNVTVRGLTVTGGLVGSLEGTGKILYSGVTGNVTADNANSSAGGLAGVLKDGAEIRGSYSSCAVNGLAYLGGLVGQKLNGTITDSYATGPVTGTNMVSGLVGRQSLGTTTNCYATGNVTGTTNIYGIMSILGGAVTGCYWDTDSTGQSVVSVGATGLTTAEMTTLPYTGYTGWDFTATWVADTTKINGGYPYLAWQVITFPEINLKQGVTNIASGSSYNYGSHLSGTSTDISFTIENTGTANLTLTLPLVTAGANAGEFSITTQPVSPVAPGNNTTFTVRFSPASAGNKTATIAITNNDGDENPYNLTLTGTGADAGGGGGGGGGDPFPVEIPIQVTGIIDNTGAAKPLVTDLNGKVANGIKSVSSDGMLTVNIPKDTVMTANNQPVHSLTIETVNGPLPPTGNLNVIGLAYRFGPEGTSFTIPLTITIKYQEKDIPQGISEEDLKIAWFNEQSGQWEVLECTVDTVNNTISAQIKHFSSYAIVWEKIIVPASFQLTGLSINPPECQPGELVYVSTAVTNNGTLSGNYTLIMKLNGMEKETRLLTLASGKTETISFTVKTTSSGVFNVDINGKTGRFTVETPPATPPPATTIAAIAATVPAVSALPITPPPAPAEIINPPATQNHSMWWLIGGGGITVLIVSWLIYRRFRHD